MLMYLILLLYITNTIYLLKVSDYYPIRIRSYNHKHFGEVILVDSNKYSHHISYNMKFACNKRYQLYGVSNHRGDDTSGGHYSATVQCRTDDSKWYDISDLNVNPVHSKSALSREKKCNNIRVFQDTKTGII